MQEQGHGTDAASCAPGLLYHYTTQTGLLGILESKSIWATHSRHLNDSSELQLGIEMFKVALADLRLSPETLSRTGFGQLPPKKVGEIEGILREVAESMIKGMATAETFVASFFEGLNGPSDGPLGDLGDTLEQWRAYSGGAGGFSIGFDKEEMVKHLGHLIESRAQIAQWGGCTYEIGVQKESLQRGIQEIGDAFLNNMAVAKSGILADLRELARDPSVEHPAQVLSKASTAEKTRIRSLVGNRFIERVEPSVHAVSRIVMRTVLENAFMKGHAFRAEREWRIARFSYGPPEDIRFRPGQSSLVPYVAIDLPIGPTQSMIRRVVVGPTPRIEEAMAAAKLLLQSKGFKIAGPDSLGIEISPSKVPFRNW
jgi:hypothetical protein